MLLTESRIPNIAKKAFGTKKTGWIGIDFDSVSINIAQVKKQNNGWELLNHQILPLQSHHQTSSENDHPDSETQPPDLMESITNTLRHKPMLFSLFNGRKAACLLPISITPLQTFNIPDGDPHDLQMMIQQEIEMQTCDDNAEKEFIFWKDNFAWPSQDGMIKTSVVSAPKDDILQLANGLLKSSVHCQTISVRPIAITRAIQLRKDVAPEEIQSGFDWETSLPVFTIVQNDEPVFSRVFRHCGFEKITQILQDHMGLNIQESLHLLKNYQSPEQSQEMKAISQTISEMLKPAIKTLFREFKKTLGFVKQNRSNLLPTQMWLFGPGAGLSQVEDLLTKMTGINTQIWTLPTDHPVPGEDSKLLQAKLGPAMAMSTMAYEL